MAATTNTRNTNTAGARNDVEFTAAEKELAAQFRAGRGATTGNLFERLGNRVADTVADLGVPAARIYAAASAAGDNFIVERSGEEHRQSLRTAKRALELAKRYS